VEIMGNKAGWLTLYSGIAGGADVILIPEIPYDIKKIAEAVLKREENNKFSIIAVAEGALTADEADMKKKEREGLRKDTPFDCVSKRIAAELTEMIGVDTRNCVPGHIQRGGSPCAFDRVLATRLGVHAAELIRDEVYGVTVALSGKDIIHNKLEDIAGSPKLVSGDNNIILTARNIGISFGD
jgi:6-phosphofructokinase